VTLPTHAIAIELRFALANPQPSDNQASTDWLFVVTAFIILGV
jgi:hypothetical protein